MADNAKDIQLRELKDSIAELKSMVKTLQEMLEAANTREKELRQERDNFKEQVEYLTKKFFGASSEKGACDIPGQISLFNEAEAVQDPAIAKTDELAATETPSCGQTEKKPRKYRSTNEERFKGLPIETVYLEPSEEERICQKCGTPMEKIGTEFVRREVKIIPARAKVVEYYSVNYGCPSCKEKAEASSIVKGKDGRAHMMHGMASASTVAWVVYQKYCNGMPLYRLEQDLQRLGAKVSRATLANWVIQNAEEFFAPVYDYFRRKLLTREFVMADESPLQVLHEPERRAQTKSYVCYALSF